MLKWQEENGRHLGFDDGTLLYIVDYDENAGWCWIDAFEGWCACNYTDAEEAKADAENNYAIYPKDLSEDDEPFLTLENLSKILDDMPHEES